MKMPVLAVSSERLLFADIKRAVWYVCASSLIHACACKPRGAGSVDFKVIRRQSSSYCGQLSMAVMSSFWWENRTRSTIGKHHKSIYNEMCSCCDIFFCADRAVRFKFLNVP